MATPVRLTGNQDVVVTIEPDPIRRTIAITPDRFVLSKKQNQVARWVCQSGEYFTVEFEKESPFYESQFSSEFHCSGLVRRPVLPDKKKHYKYTVRISGYPDLDPECEVDQ